jgi:hypothetical protein
MHARGMRKPASAREIASRYIVKVKAWRAA